MQYGVEDFEKTVAAVRDDTKVLVVLQNLTSYLVKPSVVGLIDNIRRM